jgi:SAM-dependent methyltransferase
LKLDCLDLHECPKCAGSLHRSDPDTGGDLVEIESGELCCAECRATYPIVRGVPRFVGAENYADSFGFQWNRHRETQLDSYTGFSISRDRLFGTTLWNDDLAGETLLEAGSGSGRFTEILAQTGARVFTFDFSSAVDANRANTKRFANVNLFQADIFSIPVRKGSFDKVICLGVLQHTPDPALAFQSLLECVRPGGELVIDVYRKDLVGLLSWKYALRPLTRRMRKERLYDLVHSAVPPLIPVSRQLRRVAGRAGARLVPISEYSHLGLPPELNEQWAILDTFDLYSPAHDHPQSRRAVRRWFTAAGFEDVWVGNGFNGVVGRGRRPAQ